MTKEIYQEFHSVIQYLLENKIRLEQEALLTSDEILKELLNKLFQISKNQPKKMKFVYNIIKIVNK